MSEAISLEACHRALSWAEVPPAARLADYMHRLLDWNEKINVTGAKDAQEFAAKHVADVWMAYQTIGSVPESVIDVGSGGGLPGIVLAIISPQTSVTLVERRQKKASVLASVVSHLELDSRVKIVSKSFEEVKRFPPGSEYWFRGFLPGPKLAVYLSEFFPHADLGQLVLMKGPAWPEEKLEIMNTPKVRSKWAERFGGAAEMNYSLPHQMGERMLVLV